MAQNDFENLTRQYWTAWGDAMRTAGAPAQPAMPNWNDAMSWWSQMAKGAGSFPNTGVDDAVDRFNSQARDWYGQIQQLAARFAGQNAAPADIASAWKQMLGGQGMADLFKGMSGPGQHGVDQWMQQMAPLLQSMQRDGRSWLGLPAFGFAREHQERLQALAQAQLELQDKTNAYNALMAETMQLALRRFEDKLAERSEPGRQLTSARALFDLWIDAAEEAYAEIALSPRFRETYGEYVNAQMRVRGALQREVEQTCDLLGMPTRTEIDAAHRKIVQLEREVRRMRDALQREAPARAGTAADTQSASPSGTARPAEKPAKAAGPSTGKSTDKVGGKSAGKSNGKPAARKGSAR
ncbi:class III poly(R)-hydroxyalkanoic acid synthase subunit PhaE [Agrilutibacter solisilvae]|uniref:Poly(3-hydroxyalkanoate) polymerase subunit PhaE n=1 Tax=Agrilutibacter solisilvae TaxID=2763317 RepID=A0A974XYH9_9GAMM|nr:class III poly(R)-hydroxyalkanoic acid synthase subunit PhaE [Lysobacter solisilvae]QSX78132.1 class III poly(R)-hydroxyalkanoic acid synthase subunit PhaE [Lysobacter solisilvae]